MRYYFKLKLLVGGTTISNIRFNCCRAIAKCGWNKNSRCWHKQKGSDILFSPVYIIVPHIYESHMWHVHCSLEPIGTDTETLAFRIRRACVYWTPADNRPARRNSWHVLFLSWVSIASHVVHLVEIMASYWLLTAKLIRKYTVRMPVNVLAVLVSSLFWWVRALLERHVAFPFCCYSIVCDEISSNVHFSLFRFLPRYLRILFLEFALSMWNIHRKRLLRIHSRLFSCGLSDRTKMVVFLNDLRLRIRATLRRQMNVLTNKKKRERE